MEEDEFNRTSTVIRYIDDNPGSTKQGIVNALKDKYSRVTIFNTLKKLEEDEMIRVDKDKPNSQIHHLFVDSKNIITRQIYELNEFEKAFIRLLLRINEENAKAYRSAGVLSYEEMFRRLKEDIENHRAGSKRASGEYKDPTVSLVKMVVDRQLIFAKALQIFYDVLQVYVIRSICEWPFKIKKDRKSLSELTSLCFNRLNQIQVKTLNIILDAPFYQTSEGHEAGETSFYQEQLIKAMDGLHDLESTSRYFIELGLSDEVEPVIKFVSNIKQGLQSSPSEQIATT